MQVNIKKTNVIIFNLTKKLQCIPFCSLVDGEPLPVVSEMRLLGMILDDRMSWWPLVQDIIKRSKAKLWSLLKLREAGAAEVQLHALYSPRSGGWHLA